MADTKRIIDYKNKRKRKRLLKDYIKKAFRGKKPESPKVFKMQRAKVWNDRYAKKSANREGYMCDHISFLNDVTPNE